MTWFSNIKTGNKLIIGYALIVIITGLVGLAGLRSISVFTRQQKDTFQFNTVPIGILGVTGDHYQQIRIELRNAVLAKDKSEEDKFAANVQKGHKSVEEKLAELDKWIRVPDQRKTYDLLVEEFKRYGNWEKKILGLVREDKNREAFEVLQSDAYNNSTEVIRNELAKLQEMKTASSKRQDTESEATGDSAERIMIILLLASMAISAALALFFSRLITRQLGGEPKEVCEIANLVAGGDLSRKIVVASGDTTSVMAAMKKMVKNLKELISQITDARTVAEESAKRLEFVLEGSNDATWEWDMITSQGFLNTRYYEMIEYTPEEVDFDFAFFLKTIHPDDVSKVQRRLQDYLEGKTDRYEAHYRMVSKSGKLRDVMGRGKVVRYDEEGRPIRMAGLISDVSEKKKLDDELNKIHNLESIGLLAGGLAHDFNNVLNVIYGNISFAKMLVGGNTAVAEPLTDAEEACERAKELGIRLQAFAQGNAPVKEPISLPVIVESVAGTLFKGSNILPTIAAADDLLPVEADPRQIRQVLENLLTNAKEALAAGGTVTINIENYLVDRKNILPVESGNYLRIAIKDSGKGIPEENLPKIFDPYFSTKDTYSQKGLGLGLSICHAILKRHHGHISVESTVGVGTIVTIFLPASPLNSQFRPT